MINENEHYLEDRIGKKEYNRGELFEIDPIFIPWLEKVNENGNQTLFKRGCKHIWIPNKYFVEKAGDFFIDKKWYFQQGVWI